MPITQRRSASTTSTNVQNGINKLETTPREDSLLISYEESLKLVPWQTDNDHIRVGYRPQLYTFNACMHSAFACEFLAHDLTFKLIVCRSPQ